MNKHYTEISNGVLSLLVEHNGSQHFIYMLPENAGKSETKVAICQLLELRLKPLIKKKALSAFSK